MRRVAFVAAILLGLLAPSTHAGATSRASLPDIEDEVMCPICGTLLELSTSPQAERERVFIRRQIADGRSKEQIKDALVAQYGGEVLALPGDSGFDLSAYLVPVIAFFALMRLASQSCSRSCPMPRSSSAPRAPW